MRCGIKKKDEVRKKYVHMLNGTLCATERALCCLVENYQRPDVSSFKLLHSPPLYADDRLPIGSEDTRSLAAIHARKGLHSVREEGSAKRLYKLEEVGGRFGRVVPSSLQFLLGQAISTCNKDTELSSYQLT